VVLYVVFKRQGLCSSQDFDSVYWDSYAVSTDVLPLISQELLLPCEIFYPYTTCSATRSSEAPVTLEHYYVEYATVSNASLLHHQEQRGTLENNYVNFVTVSNAKPAAPSGAPRPDRHPPALLPPHSPAPSSLWHRPPAPPPLASVPPATTPPPPPRTPAPRQCP